MAASEVREFTPRLLHDLHSEQQLGEKLFKMEINITELDNLNCFENWRKGVLAITPKPPPGAKPDFSNSWGGRGGGAVRTTTSQGLLARRGLEVNRPGCSGASWLLKCSASTKEASEGRGSCEQTGESLGVGSWAGGGGRAAAPPAGRGRESKRSSGWPRSPSAGGFGKYLSQGPFSPRPMLPLSSKPLSVPVLGGGGRGRGAGCEGRGLALICLLPQGHRWLLGGSNL